MQNLIKEKKTCKLVGKSFKWENGFPNGSLDLFENLKQAPSNEQVGRISLDRGANARLPSYFWAAITKTRESRKAPFD